MKVQLTGMTAWQATPISGTLRIYPQGRYEDAQGNATPGRYDFVLDTPSRTWRDQHNLAAYAYIVVAGLGDPAEISAVFEETFRYAGGAEVRQTYQRALRVSDLLATEYNYVEPQDIARYLGQEPITMRAARDVLALGGALNARNAEALADLRQNLPRVANRAALAGQPAGAYIITSENVQLVWNGNAVVADSVGPVLAEARQFAALKIVSVLDAEFGADPTGQRDSSAAFQAAVDSVAVGASDSAYVAGQGYGRVRVPAGTYIVGDVVVKSGVEIVGDGKFATQILPKAGSAWAFKSEGSVPIEQHTPFRRQLAGALRHMSLGTANYDDIVGPIPAGVGGIHQAHTSYLELDSLYIRRLAGTGLRLDEYFDGAIYDVTIINCGSATVPALDINGGEGVDSTNAMRVFGLHVEHVDYIRLSHLRHAQYVACKIEVGADMPNAVGVKAIGCIGTVWVAPQLTWAKADATLFEFSSAPATDTRPAQDSVGNVILAPVCIGPGTYFRNLGVMLEITAPQMYSAGRMASGEYIKITGGASYDCGDNGPYLNLGRASSVRDHSFIAHKSGPTAVVTLSGDADATDNRFQGQAGGAGQTYIYSQAGHTGRVMHNRLGVGRGIGITIESTAADIRDNYAEAGVTPTFGRPAYQSVHTGMFGGGRPAVSINIPAAVGDTKLPGVPFVGAVLVLYLVGQNKMAVLVRKPGSMKFLADLTDDVFVIGDAGEPRKYILFRDGEDLYVRNRTGVADTLNIGGFSVS